jgi:hypothetical protein
MTTIRDTKTNQWIFDGQRSGDEIRAARRREHLRMHGVMPVAMGMIVSAFALVATGCIEAKRPGSVAGVLEALHIDLQKKAGPHVLASRAVVPGRRGLP